MKPNSLVHLFEKSFQEPYRPSLTLGFEALPAEALFNEWFIPELHKIEPLQTEVLFDLQYDASRQSLWATISFEKHAFGLWGKSIQHLDENIVQNYVNPSHWELSLKAPFLKTTYLLHLTTLKPVPNECIETYIALHKVALSFVSYGLLGVLNEPSWQFLPPFILQKMLLHGMANVCRNAPPWLFWTGLLKIFLTADTIILSSKGHHVFGLPDLAFFTDHPSNIPKIQQIFNQVLEYAWYENKTLQPGDVLAWSEQEQYELVLPEDNLPIFQSPLGTLMLRILN